VTQRLATKALTAGAAIHTATPVKRVELQDGRATGGDAAARAEQ
jgi:phytoene dehydrogenase-like protein